MLSIDPCFCHEYFLTTRGRNFRYLASILKRSQSPCVGALVALAEQGGCDLADLTLDQMQSVHGAITEDVFAVLGVDNSVASRTSYGGTAPAQVRAQISRWREVLA